MRNGEIDTCVYVKTCEMPNVHLTRRGTIRILENVKKEMPNLKLKNDLNTRAIESHPEERQTRPSFSHVVRSTRSTAKVPARNNSPDGHILEVKTIVGGMLGTEKRASTVGSRITCNPNVEQKGI